MSAKDCVNDEKGLGWATENGVDIFRERNMAMMGLVCWEGWDHEGQGRRGEASTVDVDVVVGVGDKIQGAENGGEVFWVGRSDCRVEWSRVVNDLLMSPNIAKPCMGEVNISVCVRARLCTNFFL